MAGRGNLLFCFYLEAGQSQCHVGRLQNQSQISHETIKKKTLKTTTVKPTIFLALRSRAQRPGDHMDRKVREGHLKDSVREGSPVSWVTYELTTQVWDKV